MSREIISSKSQMRLTWLERLSGFVSRPMLPWRVCNERDCWNEALNPGNGKCRLCEARIGWTKQAAIPSEPSPQAGISPYYAINKGQDTQIDQQTYDDLIASGKSERIARSKAKAAWIRKQKAQNNEMP